MRLIPYLLVALFFACSSVPQLPDSYSIITNEAGGTCIAYKVSRGFTYFITCYHVIEGANLIKINGDDAEIIQTFKEIDTAVLRVQKTYKNILVLDRLPPNIRTKVMGIGYPKGAGPLVTEGYVAESVTKDKTMWLCSAPTCPGCSGGPVVDIATNKVIGMTRSVAMFDSNMITHMHFFVPTYIICDYLSREGLL